MFTSPLSEFIVVWIMFSASPLPGWHVIFKNKTSNSLQLQWMDISHRLNGGARFFVVIAKSSYNVPIRKIFGPNITSAKIAGLDTYTVYNVSVVAIDGNGLPFNSSILQERTDESGEYKLFILLLLKCTRRPRAQYKHILGPSLPVRCIQAIFGFFLSWSLETYCHLNASSH